MASYSLLRLCECGTRLLVPYQPDGSLYQQDVFPPRPITGYCPHCGRLVPVPQGRAFTQLPSNPLNHLQPSAPSNYPYNDYWRQGLRDGYYQGLQDFQPHWTGQLQQPSYLPSDQSTHSGYHAYNPQVGQDDNSNVLPPGYITGMNGAQQPRQETTPTPTPSESTDSMYPWLSNDPSRANDFLPASSPESYRSSYNQASQTHQAPGAPGLASRDIYMGHEGSLPWVGSNSSFAVEDPRFWASSRHEGGATSASSSSSSTHDGISDRCDGGRDPSSPVDQAVDNTPPAKPSGDGSADISEDDDQPLVFTNEGQLLLLGDAWIVPTAQAAREGAGPTRGRAEVRSTHETVDEDGNTVVVDIREGECDCDLTMSGAIQP